MRTLSIKTFLVLLTFLTAIDIVSYSQSTKLKALIIDGENNHGVWPKSTMMMKDFLEQTGLFKVDIYRSAFTWQGGAYNKMAGVNDIKELLTLYPLDNGQKTTAVEKPQPDPNFNPNFSEYDVVVSNFGWGASNWPQQTKKNFETYMAEGGGLVVVHAANNAWGDWPEYNKMIALGGWGDRNAASGTFANLDDDGKLHKDIPEGGCGAHGAQQEFLMINRSNEHPIMKGIPEKWLHTMDELYERMCGPAEHMTILVTSYSDPEKNGKGRTGRHEPLIFTVDYEKGRVFHTMLGHMDYSMECVGFMTTFQRGTEWAATGSVTIPVPDDFPGQDKVSVRNWE